MTTVNSSTVILAGPAGSVPITVVPAEAGMLAFATYAGPLLPGAAYSLSLNGLTDPAGRPLPQTEISFTTTAELGSGDGEAWISNGSDWRTHRADSTWQKLPPLQAPEGTTAIAGQTLRLNGLPLPNVTFQVGAFSARSDSTGRFLLTLGNGTSGQCVLVMIGATANTPGKTYGLFQYAMDVQPGITNVLSFTIWMPLLDMAQAVSVPSPTKKDMVIASPLLPGLELLLPAGTVIWDYTWHVARIISITPIPLDRPPFPLPNVRVPIYFTIQPGGSWLQMTNPNGPKGAQLIYPNTYHSPPGIVYDFWNYNPMGQGWYVYGLGKVSPDGLHIIPNPGVHIYGFTGAMVGDANAPVNGPPACDGGAHGPTPPFCGDPIDLSTGHFVHRETDLVLPDVIPLTLTRTYRQNDPYSRAFGIGTTHTYDIFAWTPGPDSDFYLILQDGSRIRFPISNGYVCTGSPTDFYGATFSSSANGGWVVKKKDGTVLHFPISEGASTAQQEALICYQDRYGNALTLTRDSNSNLTKITSPNGRYLQFTLDSSGRITQATDNIGRVVKYVYDTSGRLSTVTDANGGVTTYTYDSNDNMLTIKDPRGITNVTNQYDSNKRVTSQTRADGSVYQVSYTLNSSGNVTAATETDPLKNVRQVTFNSNGYAVTDTRAVGTLQQELTTYKWDATTGLLDSFVDPLNRTTSYTYDSLGNVLSTTQLYGTPSAVTTSFTYDQTFSLVASITDPLNHTTNFTYDSFGNLTTLTDPLTHKWTFTYNSLGQPVSVSDPLSNQTTFTYSNSDLASMTDPLGRTTLLGLTFLLVLCKYFCSSGQDTVSCRCPGVGSA